MTIEEKLEYLENSYITANDHVLSSGSLFEIINLARLGIWAKEKAEPALIYYECYLNQPEFLKGGWLKYPHPKVAKEALDAMPGEKST